MSALPVPAPEPFDIEAAIAEIVSAELPAMREREMREMCAKVQRDEFKAWLRARQLGMLCGLMFVAVIGVGAVYELKMMGVI